MIKKKVKNSRRTKVNKTKPKITKTRTKPKVTYNQNDAEIRRIVNTRSHYYTISVPVRFAKQLSYSKGDPILVRVIGSKLVVKKLN